MKMNKITTLPIIMAISLLTSAALAGDAQNGKMSEIERTIAVQRATQVAIWAMPAVTAYGFTRGTLEDLGGKYNDILVTSTVFEPRHGLMTTNDVTPYAHVALSTENGPVVVEIPAVSDKTMIFGTFVDAWMRPIVDVGPTGGDKGKGAKYLFISHDYEGEVPTEGYLVHQLEGYSVSGGLRLISKDGGTVEEASAYGHTIKVYDFADADNPPASTYLDPNGRDWDTLPYYDLRLFEDINAIFQIEPARERDKSMFALLSAIGIKKGQTFEPTDEWKSIYEEAAGLAFAYLQDTFVTPDNGMLSFYGDDSHWMEFNISTEQAALGFPFEDDGVPLIDLRAKSYFFLSYYPKSYTAASFYIVTLLDKDGNQLNSTDTYKLNVPKDTPARDFWSVIAYGMENKGFIRGTERVGRSSRQLDEMNVNDDGSVDVYFGPKAPKGEEGNWVSTGGEDFFLMFRLYGPGEAAFDKTWQLGEIEKVK
jgi:hypothetical protein